MRASSPRRRSILRPCRAPATWHVGAHDQCRAARLGDRQGARLPLSGNPPRKTQKSWPAIPKMLLDLWEALADYPHPPEACLINYHAGAAKMGLHQDRDEEDFAAPVLSVSLAIPASSRSAAPRADPTQKFELKSAMRCARVARTVSPFTASTASCRARRSCLPEGGRFNLTSVA
ncbi:MAG: alpha-ketoglutarate-dependent dioxygenase AlkB [Hyphomicrobiales bacterium]